MHHSVIRVQKCKQKLKTKWNHRKSYMFLRCKMAFAFIITVIYYVDAYRNTFHFLLKFQIPFSKVFIFPSLRQVEIPITKLVLIEIPKSHFKKWQFPYYRKPVCNPPSLSPPPLLVIKVKMKTAVIKKYFARLFSQM